MSPATKVTLQEAASMSPQDAMRHILAYTHRITAGGYNDSALTPEEQDLLLHTYAKLADQSLAIKHP